MIRVEGVDPDEGDLTPELQRHPLEGADLFAAGFAPGGPLVDHDGHSPQRGQPRADRPRSPFQELAGLFVKRRQRRGRAGELGPICARVSFTGPLGAGAAAS